MPTVARVCQLAVVMAAVLFFVVSPPSAAALDFAGSTAGAAVATVHALDHATTNTTHSHSSNEGDVAVEPRDRASECRPPVNAPRVWKRLSDPIINIAGCRFWRGRYYTMLNAYQSRSRRELWKYTSDIDDDDCLQYWAYYDTQFKPLQAVLRTTRMGDVFGYGWCAVPVFDDTQDAFLTDGSEGKLWAYCDCPKD